MKLNSITVSVKGAWRNSQKLSHTAFIQTTKPPIFSMLPEQLVMCDKLFVPTPQLFHHLLLSPDIRDLLEVCRNPCLQMLFVWGLVEQLLLAPKRRTPAGYIRSFVLR
jgi:hypothetical protein